MKLISRLKEFINDESGNEAVEFAVIFPVLLLLVGFMIDRFIQYEGLTSLTSAANEAIRSAVVAETQDEAVVRIQETLEDRLASSKMGWCDGKENLGCSYWSGTGITTDRNVFEADPNQKLLVSVDRGWCSGGYVTLGVRAHKTSLFPSFETFQHMLRSGSPVYHSHTYIIRARVEAKEKCV
ncbi:TadE/TadG family type IV pilus assembly protein [Ileibacterium valens]|uniref:TadE/TadG family type IV pilus assembly protein n=1 Tax=Ileibacterium valens TaxID=1862668 RepID=UPI002570D50E|nr:TadE/TadG family type IV pilus assembly protein [Ileibacterium valens]